MSIRFDDKGKFFTEIVSKEAVPVVIQTLTHRINGFLHVRPDTRLKDEINQTELFLAVTEADLYDHAGNLLYSCNFMALNRESIIWILPEDQITSPESSHSVRKGGED